MTPVQVARGALDQILKTNDTPEREEVFAADINEVLDTLIETAIAETGKTVALLERGDKMWILKFLEDKGAFFVKHSMDRVARRLGISRVTAYNYLDQVRRQTG